MDLEEASGKESCTWSYQMVAHEYLKNDKSDNQRTGPGFVSCGCFIVSTLQEECTSVLTKIFISFQNCLVL